jgi:VCBS repeat-containing protein
VAKVETANQELNRPRLADPPAVSLAEQAGGPEYGNDLLVGPTGGPLTSIYRPMWTTNILIKDYQPGDFGLKLQTSQAVVDADHQLDQAHSVAALLAGYAALDAAIDAANLSYLPSPTNQSNIVDDASVQWNGKFNYFAPTYNDPGPQPNDPAPVPSPSAGQLSSDRDALENLDNNSNPPPPPPSPPPPLAPDAAPVAAVTDQNSSVTAPFAVAAANAADALSLAIVSGPSSGAVTVNSDDTFTFSPDGDFASLSAGSSQTVTFTYQATDTTTNEKSGVETVTITVEGGAASMPRLLAPSRARIKTRPYDLPPSGAPAIG